MGYKSRRKFREFKTGEVRRTPLLRRWVNKRKKSKGRYHRAPILRRKPLLRGRVDRQADLGPFLPPLPPRVVFPGGSLHGLPACAPDAEVGTPPCPVGPPI
jgi:hypothetical protein